MEPAFSLEHFPLLAKDLRSKSTKGEVGFSQLAVRLVRSGSLNPPVVLIWRGGVAVAAVAVGAVTGGEPVAGPEVGGWEEFATAAAQLMVVAPQEFLAFAAAVAARAAKALADAAAAVVAIIVEPAAAVDPHFEEVH